MTDKISAPIRGMSFRPPAGAILSVIPFDTPLVLLRESTNKHDPNAIQVHVKTKYIPKEMYEELAMRAQGMKSSLETILDQDQWFLGFVGKEIAMIIAPVLDGGADYTAILATTLSGAPVVEIGLIVEDDSEYADQHNAYGDHGDA